MPMLYGEGEKSFLRLQEEMIRSSDDHSIFAWPGVQHGTPGMLAHTLDVFANCGDVVGIQLRQGAEPYTMGDRGLAMKLYSTPYSTDTYLIALNCVRENSKKFIGIYLRRLEDDDQYARVIVNGQDIIEDATVFAMYQSIPKPNMSVNIRQRPLAPEDHVYLRDRLYGFRLDDCLLQTNKDGADLFSVRGQWDPIQKTITLNPGARDWDIVGTLDISEQRRKIKRIKFGFDDDFNPTIFLAEESALGYKGLGVDSIDFDKDKKFESRKSNDDKGWSKIYASTNGQTHAQCGAGRDGLWALRGDRINGLDVHLGHDQHDSAERHVVLRRETLGALLVWNVYVGGLRDALGKRMLNAMTAMKQSRKNDRRTLPDLTADGESSTRPCFEAKVREWKS